jgi:hypothetical protein
VKIKERRIIMSTKKPVKKTATKVASPKKPAPSKSLTKKATPKNRSEEIG